VIVQPLAVDGDDRDQHVAEVVAPGHPLVVVTPTVVIGTVESPTGEGGRQPSEELLVADVHAERDLRLASVPSEMPLADEQAEQIAHGEPVELVGVAVHGIAG
jgi:hypothetical protein